MQARSKWPLALILIGALAVAPAVAQTSIADLQSGMDDMADALASALPFNSTVGLNWSDAYIGQLIGVPPHFGIGIVTGATSIDASKISEVLKQMGYDKDLGSSLPIPAAAAEARIGGFLLPFDVGFKVGIIPEAVGDSISSVSDGLNVDYMLVGADIRYAILKGNMLLPAVSVGVGFNYLKGGLSKTISEDVTYDVNGNNLTVKAPEVGIEWECKTIDLKAQVSKGLLIFTPYLGLGASYGMSSAGYYINSDVEYNGAKISDAQISSVISDLEAAGIDAPDISSTGISSSTDVTGWAFRAFGGLSVNMVIVRLDLTGLYNISDGSYGGTLGVRVQL